VPNGELRQQAEVSLDCLWIEKLVEINSNCLKGLLMFQMEQIDAHIGGVNDIAFSHPNKSLSVITCGDDKLIKVRAFICPPPSKLTRAP
jgi:hypothetical protein